MASAVEDSSAFGAEQSGPACWIAPLIRGRPSGQPTRSSTVYRVCSLGLADREEFDREVDRTERSDFVLDVRGNSLGRAGPQHHLEYWFRGGNKTELSIVYHYPSPRAAGYSVSAEQAPRHGVLVPLGTGANQTKGFGQFRPVAQRAFEWRAKPVRAPLGLQHPRSELERRTMPDVLVVTAGELGDPVAFIVTVITSDGALHTPSVVGARSGHGWPTDGMGRFPARLVDLPGRQVSARTGQRVLTGRDFVAVSVGVAFIVTSSVGEVLHGRTGDLGASHRDSRQQLTSGLTSGLGSWLQVRALRAVICTASSR